ncbi:cytochrome P450 94C1 [Ricinus communis]|uniref:Cytochrome P450, putative n=1 Tax=Ricinus communis TaxID=3988 RepID=B9SST9_RICCO|nr:cytochrome P450 94C1 [Ricinus communis]EEF33302.1 cytochrome P450, putative [Ricinus communis]|eukprot:XP_002529058.1 cytochrome P450 94C1 [Ricinus communis]
MEQFDGLGSISGVFSLLFFGFTLLFSLFSLLIFLLRQKPWCNCDICKSYITASWAKEFVNLCDWYTHLLKKSPTGTIHIHVLGNIITSNPENVEYILKTNFENYPKGKPFSALLGDLLGRGIFNVDGDSWRFQRKMASLELGSVSIRMYAFELIMSEIKSRLIPLLSSISCDKDQQGIDLQDVFRRFSFDNICKFSFGLDPGCLKLSLPISEFALAFDTASKLSAERALAASSMIWKMKRFLNIGSEKKLKEAIQMVNELAEGVINHRRKEGCMDNKDLLSRFMGSINDDKYLRDIVISFLLAGRDTVASGLTSFFWLLSKHPQVESAIREESDRVMGSSEELTSYEQLRELHYLNAAVYESMRLFPPVQFDSKFSQEDDILPDGTFIRKGTRVTYHQYAMGRMERIWGQDCLEFKPERWLKNGVFVPESSSKYPVFHAGFRVCLGKEMALVEMKSVALTMIRAFNVRVVDPNQVPRFSPGLTATMRGGLPVVIQERET